VTVTSNATPASAASTIVSRDAAGGFAATTVNATALLAGNLDAFGTLTLGPANATAVTVVPPTTVTGPLTVNESVNLGDGGDVVHVREILRLTPLSGILPTCASMSDVGRMYFDADTDDLCVCRGDTGSFTFVGLFRGPEGCD
jgi:hypothetical protein